MSMHADTKDHLTRPSYSLANRAARLLWSVVYTLFFRPSPRFFHGWRRFLLRRFGAQIGPGCRIYSKASIWAPWNLYCEDVVLVADGAVIYNPKPIRLGSHVVVSQEAYLCGASHDYNNPAFPVISEEIHIEGHAWICARAVVQMGVRVGEGAVLALGSICAKDLEAWTVYAGVPAKALKKRVNILQEKNLVEGGGRA
jgi:putative colanic acid biosynthesis acetyltransferase WcaF